MSDTSLLSRSELKRQQILDAGRELFMAQGFREQIEGGTHGAKNCFQNNNIINVC